MTRTPKPNAPYGDPLIPRNNICRILAQNIQGITDDPLFTDARMIRDAADESRVDILCLIETNINWNKPNIKNRFKIALRDNRHSHYQFSSCTQDDTSTSYLPGGTCMIIQQPWSTKATSTTDPSGMGRWTEITLQGRRDKQITILTAYRVCERADTSHDDNTYHSQQWRHMITNEIPNPDPRQATLDDLSKRISELHQRNHAIILNIDANEHMYQTRNSKLPQWIQTNQLIDIHATLHGFTDEPETYKRGSHRIDFTLISHNLLEYITAAGILPYNTLGKGDHRALYTDVHMEQYLDDTMENINKRVPRTLTTKNPKAVKLYREKLLNFLNTSHFERDCQKLYERLDSTGGVITSQLSTEYNRLDKWITDKCLKFERQCNHIQTDPWSPTLINAKNFYHTTGNSGFLN